MIGVRKGDHGTRHDNSRWTLLTFLTTLILPPSSPLIRRRRGPSGRHEGRGEQERADDRRDERRLPRSFVSRHPFSYLGLTALFPVSHSPSTRHSLTFMP